MKVYCRDCKYYIPSTYEMGILLPESCSYIKSYRDTYYQKDPIYPEPLVENKDNDCKFYKPNFLFRIIQFFKNVIGGEK